MSERRIRTKDVLVFLGVSDHSFLERLREEGLFEGEDLAPEDAEDLRLARILMEELGVNAAGVDVALHLRRRLFALERRTRTLADALSNAQSRR